MKRCNHYDVAFEELLRRLRRPYVAVNETRRALSQTASLKSIDFIVSSAQSQSLLVDVKGRRLSPGSRCWNNWTPEDDLTSLAQWEAVFGNSFRALLVFAYDITGPQKRAQHDLIWEIQGRRYAFYGVWADEYAQAKKVYSPRWNTVTVPAETFRRLRRPLLDLL